MLRRRFPDTEGDRGKWGSVFWICKTEGRKGAVQSESIRYRIVKSDKTNPILQRPRWNKGEEIREREGVCFGPCGSDHSLIGVPGGYRSFLV